MSEFKVKLKNADGQEQEVTGQEFFQAMLKTPRVTEAHISLEEGRQRAPYEGVKRFTSRRIDFSPLWALVDTVADPKQREGMRQWVHAAIHQTIMSNEAVMYNELAHSLGRDGLSKALRDPENPFVQTHDLQQALQMLSTMGGRVAGARSGTTAK